MEKINFSVPVPKILMNFVLWFVLRHRKKQKGFAFRRIKVSDKFAMVDVEDYEKLSKYDWHYYETGNKTCYAVRFNGSKIVSMHRMIMNEPVNLVVDHKNGVRK